MHVLVGTFIKELPEEQTTEGTMWPLKIMFPPTKSRILYFSTQKDQQNWVLTIKEAIGYSSVIDYYDITHTLGKG